MLEADICSTLLWRGKSGHRRGVFLNLRANSSSCVGDYTVWKVPQRLNSSMIIREKNSFIDPRWKVSAVLFLAERHSSNRNVLVNPRWCKWVGPCFGREAHAWAHKWLWAQRDICRDTESGLLLLAFIQFFVVGYILRWLFLLIR